MNAKIHLRSYLLLVCGFVALGIAEVSHAQADYERVFIFGDSLSDSGNIYAFTGETSKAPYLLVPDRPYAIGGHHFSNGKTWAERLAQDLQDNNGGKASLDSPGRNGNYAYGGARARANSGSLSPSSATQVGMFLADYGAAPADALYVIQFGGNDLRDALIAGASNPAAAVPILLTAVNELAGYEGVDSTIEALYAAGARNFLVANAPNIEHAPAVQMTGFGAVAGFLTGIHNGVLEGALQTLEGALPGIAIQRMDMASFVNEVVANPEDFGFTNVVAPCLNFLAEKDAKCDNPEEYFFWDGLHPTAVGHRAMGSRALAALN